jgi:hypothetical protein
MLPTIFLESEISLQHLYFSKYSSLIKCDVNMFIQYISGFWELSLQHLYFSKYSSLIKCVCEHVYTVYIRILGVCTRYNKLLNGFVDGNFKCEFYTFIRPNQ